MKTSGWRTLGSSNGTSTATGSNAGDLWGSASNPLTDVYPTYFTLNTGSWIIMQGPSTLKIPISSSFSGTLLRGETLNQSSTNAICELIGCNYGNGSVNGYLVAAPRVSGSSTGSFGYSQNDLVATTTNTTINIYSPIQEYVREVVFWRGSNPAQGSIYYQCVLSGTVSSSNPTDLRFSQLTGSVGCTATVAPGGGGVNNGFPVSGSLVVLGTGNTASHANWSFSNYAGNIGYSQIMCVDATTGNPSSSADGTFNIAIGLTTTGTRVYAFFGFNALDNTENGDIDPYIWNAPSLTTNETRTRLANTSLVTPAVANGNSIIFTNYNTYDGLVGFRRRGMNTNDTFQNFSYGIIFTTQNSAAYINISYTISSVFDSEATSLVPRRIKEPIWVLNYNTASKMRKGTFRWIYAGPADSIGSRANDTYDNRYWFQVTDGPTNFISLIAGPYDGVSNPVNG
jgi:hypothetical protein